MKQYADLDEVIPVTLFSAPRKKGGKVNSPSTCTHIGALEHNGSNYVKGGHTQRVKCAKCGKRFGTPVTPWELLEYECKIKTILYELFSLGYPLSGLARAWQVPEEKLSRFKKKVVRLALEQNPDLIEARADSLPGGLVLGDETFFGQRGNSDTEIVFIDKSFKVLASGPAQKGQLAASIQATFANIPEECARKIRVLGTDGEPSYKSLALLLGGGVVHFAQLHNRKQLGQVVINKFEKLGPHHFHYQIKTHWKAFNKGTHLLRFRWEIKLVQGHGQGRRGRPPKSKPGQQREPKWRQKLRKYQSPKFQRSGSAGVFVNFDTNKLTMKRGARKWMIRMLGPLFKLFKGKCITTNLVESKHSQVKRKGHLRKQRDANYGHELFVFTAFVAETSHLPPITLTGRPLWKYLMKPPDKKVYGYSIPGGNGITIQTVLPAFMQG